jgi:hypothetical protein
MGLSKKTAKTNNASSSAVAGNTAANATREKIEKRLLLFAVLTFLGHTIISLMLVSEFKAFLIFI